MNNIKNLDTKSLLQQKQSIVGYIIWIFITAFIYAGLAYISFTFFKYDNFITLIWLPTGLGIFLFFKYGEKSLPALLLANLLYAIPSNIEHPLTIFLIVTANILGPIIATHFLKKNNFKEDFYSKNDIISFLLYAALISTFISALIGCIGFYIFYDFTLFAYIQGVFYWWVSDAIGVIIVTPALFTFSNLAKKEISKINKLTITLLLLLFLCNLFLFFDIPFKTPQRDSLILLPLLFILALSLTSKSTYTFFAVLMTSLIAILGITLHKGVFFGGVNQFNILNIWIYIVSCAAIANIFVFIRSESEKTNNKLRVNEAKFKALSEAGLEALLILKNDEILNYNHAANRLLGLSNQTEEKQCILTFVSPEFLQIFQNSMQDPNTNTFEITVQDINEKKTEVEVNVRIYDNNEDLKIIALRDLSSIKKMLLITNELNQKLLIKEKALTNQLNISNNINTQLSKTNKELNHFVYSASHDIRAPISSALGLIGLARLELDNNNIMRYLDLQEKSLLKLDNFIEEILNYAKNKNFKVIHEKIDVGQCIEKVWQTFEYNHKYKHIKRITEINDKPLLLNSDPYRIRLILENLIANALKYSKVDPDKNPWVKIKALKTTNSIMITVEDNGVGIETDRLPYIFDMFYRAHNNSEGSGLGLYLVKESAQKIGADIKVESVPLKGTKFTLTFENQA